MSVYREMAEIAKITIPHWRRDVALVIVAVSEMVALLWIPRS